MNIIRPQEGFQKKFASTNADVVFGGGAAASGKSFGLVLAFAQPLLTDPNFRCLISRRNLGNQKAGGGFVEKFKQIFTTDYIRVKEADSPRVTFPNGSFCDLTYIDDSNMDKLRERAKGWEYDAIAIDELTEMSWDGFSYVMTRNRGQSKTFTGKFFATLNPKRSHWSRIFLDWYIGVDGRIIPERDGVVRYFYAKGKTVKDVVWGETKEAVYLKCKSDIDRKIEAIGGNFSYENFIKSFVFYQGRLGENKALVESNANYAGSVAASGGAMSQALLEGNFNVDPDEEAHQAIKSANARMVFVNDQQVNGDLWITIDLADYGTDNMVMLAWNGFHIYDLEVVVKSTPRENAERARIFAAKNNTGEAHIIYDATAGRYFSDYIPDAVPYISARHPFGPYGLSVMTLKDMCYIRLCNMINHGAITISEGVANRTYTHQNLKYNITVETEFLEECSVVRFDLMASGKRRLQSKKMMNRNLGSGRSMDLLDPCAMRMLPCAHLEYGEELRAGFASVDLEHEEMKSRFGVHNSIYDQTIWA